MKNKHNEYNNNYCFCFNPDLFRNNWPNKFNPSSVDTLINRDDFRNRNMIQSKDGNLVLLGYTENTKENAHLVKWDKTGKILWDNIIRDELFSRPFNFIEDDKGNFYVCGYSSKGGETKGGFLYKINKDGVLQWKNSFEKSRFADLVLSSNKDGIYLYAETGDFPQLNNQILKVDFSGKVLWTKTLPAFINEPLRMTIFKDNMVLLGSLNARNKKKAISLTSIDAGGNLIWEKIFATDYNYYPEEIIATKTGDFLIVGSVNNKGFVLKVDKKGNMVWEKSIPKGEYVKFYDIIELENENLVITGLYKSNEIGALWVVITSSDGELKMEKSINKLDNRFSWGQSLVILKDRSIAISANTQNADKKLNTWLLKVKLK